MNIETTYGDPAVERWATALQPERSSVHISFDDESLAVSAQLDIVLDAATSIARGDRSYLRVQVGVPPSGRAYVALLDGEPEEVLDVLTRLHGSAERGQAPAFSAWDWQDWDYKLRCWSYREDAPYAERREAVAS